MKKALFLTLLPLAVLVGCSSQNIRPATDVVNVDEVCVPPDYSARKVAYNCTLTALRQKGFTVREVTEAQALKCRTVLRVQTESRWDLGNFTSRIDYEWLENGKSVASSHYHASNGLNFNKFVNTQEKVNDMLNKMLPSTPKLYSRYENK